MSKSAAPVGDLAVTGSAPHALRHRTSEPVPAPWYRHDDSWLRLRAAIGWETIHSSEIELDAYVDDVWRTTRQFAERPWPRRKIDD